MDYFCMRFYTSAVVLGHRRCFLATQIRKKAFKPSQLQLAGRLPSLKWGCAMKKKLLLTCMVATLLFIPAAAQAWGRVGFFVGPGFGWGWYGSYWGPYPYGYYGAYYGPSTGAVKFDTKIKDAQVFIDGAFAGTVGQLKTLHLRPGTYNLELRAPGGMRYAERIYVARGKTLHVNPDLPNQTQR
jgi:hypothetical protein